MKSLMGLAFLFAVNSYAQSSLQIVPIEMSVHDGMTYEQSCSRFQYEIKKALNRKLSVMGVSDRGDVSLSVKVCEGQGGGMQGAEFRWKCGCVGKIVLQSEEVGLFLTQKYESIVKKDFEDQENEKVSGYINTELNRPDVVTTFLVKEKAGLFNTKRYFNLKSLEVFLK